MSLIDFLSDYTLQNVALGAAILGVVSGVLLFYLFIIAFDVIRLRNREAYPLNKYGLEVGLAVVLQPQPTALHVVLAECLPGVA